MEHYAGIDVSLEQSSVCVVDGAGRVVREAKVASEPEALVRFFGQLGLVVARIGLEAGPLSQWLHAGLSDCLAGQVVCHGVWLFRMALRMVRSLRMAAVSATLAGLPRPVRRR